VIVAPDAAEIECFRGLVAERLGLYFEDGKLDFLADVLRQRMADTGCERRIRKRISQHEVFGGKKAQVACNT
jgi:hypothetical protein